MSTTLYSMQLAADRDLPVSGSRISVDKMSHIAQRIETRLQLHRGEWLLDTSKGLPLNEWTQQKPPNVDDIGAQIRAEIASTPGVVAVLTWSGSFDIEAQRLTYGGKITTLDGVISDASTVVDAVDGVARFEWIGGIYA